MNSKEQFVNFLEERLFNDLVLEEIDPEVANYWQDFKTGKIGGKSGLTDNGKMLMQFFQSHSADEQYTAKDIAEDLFIQARTVSGAMRSLVNSGYVTKIEGKPNKYQVTDEGMNLVIE